MSQDSVSSCCSLEALVKGCRCGRAASLLAQLKRQQEVIDEENRRIALEIEEEKRRIDLERTKLRETAKVLKEAIEFIQTDTTYLR